MSDENIYEWVIKALEDTKEQVFEAVEKAGDEGVESMRETIRTQGAQPQWQGDWTGFQRREGKPLRYGSTPGRVHTGNMIDSVDKSVKKEENSIRVEFGWINQGRFEEYFMHQEHGFRNVLAGVNVEGMHALANGALVAQTELERGMS